MPENNYYEIVLKFYYQKAGNLNFHPLTEKNFIDTEKVKDDINNIVLLLKEFQERKFIIAKDTSPIDINSDFKLTLEGWLFCKEFLHFDNQ